MSARVLGIIPARGGSKGVPRKNIRSVGGKPLIAWTIDAAKESQTLTRTLVSTDDEEIAKVAREAGADVPFLRPAELATDRALTLPVLQHALAWAEAEEGSRYDAVVLLQPTCPLRTAQDIDICVRQLLASTADSVVSVVDVGPNHPFRMKRLLDDGRLINFIDQGFEDMRPRQELPPVYIRCGSIYASRRDVVAAGPSVVGPHCLAYAIPAERAINIDGELDLLTADHLLSRR